MISSQEQRHSWELAAALAVLEKAQGEMATLRNVGGDRLHVAQRRYSSARRIVQRIRAVELQSRAMAQ